MVARLLIIRGAAARCPGCPCLSEAGCSQALQGEEDNHRHCQDGVCVQVVQKPVRCFAALPEFLLPIGNVLLSAAPTNILSRESSRNRDGLRRHVRVHLIKSGLQHAEGTRNEAMHKYPGQPPSVRRQLLSPPVQRRYHWLVEGNQVEARAHDSVRPPPPPGGQQPMQ